jgi:hypothetical protein
MATGIAGDFLLWLCDGIAAADANKVVASRIMPVGEAASN